VLIMTAPLAEQVFHGRVSADGRLVQADPILLEMQEDAGGVLHGPLVIPALARLVQIARRTGATLARPLTVGASDRDIALWARIRPTDEGAQISAALQDVQPMPRQDRIDDAALDAHAAMAGDGWFWQVDRQLRFTLVDSALAPKDAALPQPGDALTAFFRLCEADGQEGSPLPMLDAVAAARPFAGQPATLRADERHRYALSGLPLLDGLGRLTGYRGKARPILDDASASEAPAHTDWSPQFGRKLDNALRQPLGRIIANANTISGQLEGPLRHDYVSYAQDIAAAGRHLLELVDDIADLQAIERPDFTAAKERVDLADLARRASGLLKMRAAEKHIAVEAPKAGETVLAEAEYRRVLQILVNLIGNAVRYSPGGSQVWVRADEDLTNRKVAVVVADQGRGIALEDQERIFARFERLQPDDTAGSGLGLYISRRLARAMGGDITVDSAPGQGARFTLTLPIWPESRRDQPAPLP